MIFAFQTFIFIIEVWFCTYTAMQTPWEKQSTCVAPKMKIALVRPRGKNQKLQLQAEGKATTINIYTCVVGNTLCR